MKFPLTQVLIQFLFLLALVFLINMSAFSSNLNDARTPCFGTFQDGPHAVIGEIDSRYMNPALYQNTTVALVDISNYILGNPEKFIQDEHQILGYFTDSLFPSPGRYRIDLPIEPMATSVDLDNNKHHDKGVRVFALYISANLTGNSYLQQLEQFYTKVSGYLDDSGLLKGSVLVYAPDGNQRFPAGPGADQKWFTRDDPTTALEMGYTKVSVSGSGAAVLDRSTLLEFDPVPAPASEIPDFSDQGILESYNSLLDLLKERYAYTEYRNLNWDTIRARYLGAVRRADLTKDFSSFFLVLDSLAMSIEDAHVKATATANIEALNAREKVSKDLYGAGVGASVIQLWPKGSVSPEGNPVVVLTVGEDGPAAKAGWIPGTEIVSVNGVPASQWLEKLPLTSAMGVKVLQQMNRLQRFLAFPENEEVSFEYRIPGEDRVRKTTLKSGVFDNGLEFPYKTRPPIDLDIQGKYVILAWDDFVSHILTKISVLEEAIQLSLSNSSAGVIIDLRGNRGGYVSLYETMASYFFTKDKPMRKNINEEWLYDPDKGSPVNSFTTDYYLSTPRPDLPYEGPLYILVDNACQSSCEYFADHLKRLGRATIIGQYPSIGAGGAVTSVVLPGGLGFNYTWGRTVIAGTETPNLEAKGVEPDVRVPVTLETELAKLRGEDPILEAALEELDRVSNPMVRLSRVKWKWVSVINMATREETQVEQTDDYILIFNEDGTMQIQADCNKAQGTFSVDQYSGMKMQVGPSTLALCSPDSKSEAFLKDLEGVSGYSIQADNLVLLVSAGGQTLAMGFEAVLD